MAIEVMATGTPDVRTCPGCHGEIAPGLLSCPSCRRLVHAERLKELADAAEDAESAGDVQAALAAWREAAGLLPPESRQYAAIAGRIEKLGRRAEASGSRPLTTSSVNPADSGAIGPSMKRAGGVATGVIGTFALALWKFKFLAVVFLTKAKFLLLGLTKASTFLTMFAALGVYWTAFGFWFALGLVVSIYIHEMGHVVALMRYGVKASAPLFIPGLGAVVLLKQDLIDPKQDARVGLAGPIWGLGAALGCLLVYGVTGKPIWGALAQFGGLINLFNLLPFWQLDGGRAFRSLSRSQRWLAVASIAAAWAVIEEPLLPILILAGAARTVMDKTNPKPDSPVLGQYAVLIWALSALSRLPVLVAP
jgi:Zn-dependent protease